ncbi:MAG: hypothetical protein ACREX6_07235 [Casimicrobiaceae bacterium]
MKSCGAVMIGCRFAVVVVLLAASALVAPIAAAHSASDAYLTLDEGARTASGKTVVRGQWDVALRDLDFVLPLDTNGDGNITWGELRPRQAAIERYAYGTLHMSADGKACTLRPLRQRVDNHADGAYAALSFEITCAGTPARLTLNYRLFFAIDPSHRCILIFRTWNGTATALLSPNHASVNLALQAGRTAPATGPR